MNYQWQYAKPENEGADLKLLNTITEYLKIKQYRLINSILVIKNNKIIWENYYNDFTPQSKNNIKSIWKSILAILVGIMLEKKILNNLDEPIAKYLPDFAKRNHLYHRLITIKHLLTMTSGIYWHGGIHYHCPMLEQMFAEDNWQEYLADIAVSHYPGANFKYKEWDVILLSAIIGQLLSANAFAVCQEYLYKPLGIASDKWSASGDGISYSILPPEESSNLTARDLGKIGLLLLHKGIFNGQRIVEESYLKAATSPSQCSNEYGYLFWLIKDGFACRGYGGQEINILPHKNAIVILQAKPTLRSKFYHDLVESIIIPALGD